MKAFASSSTFFRICNPKGDRNRGLQIPCDQQKTPLLSHADDSKYLVKDKRKTFLFPLLMGIVAVFG